MRAARGAFALSLSLLVPLAAAGYGDCSCSCCPFQHPQLDCTPIYQGYNTLSSCSSCSNAFCASHYPSACPASPHRGGQFGFGGHASFTCDGWDNNLTTDAEGGDKGDGRDAFAAPEEEVSH